jgi:hypothetical protein
MENTNVDEKKESQELKNIKYKTMLFNGMSFNETKSSSDMLSLEKFLEAEKITNSNEPWCKLNKTIKTKKILEFIECYSKEKGYDEEENNLLTAFLKDSIDKKKLSRVKDVIYDKITGTVKEIPALTYIKSNKHFTLKNIDKRVSTLKSLAPKKSGTIRNKLTQESQETNKENNDSDSNDED